MKKLILSAALLIAVCISANAQFSLGIKGGVNYSNINTDQFKNSGVAGYQLGVFARAGSGVYLQPEIYVSSTGGHLEANDNSFGGNVRFTNLTVPVLVGFQFGPKNLNFRLMAGPEYNYLLNTSETFTQNANSALYDFGRYKNSTLGYQAGFGVDIGPITTDLRYQGNLNDVNPNYGERPNIWALSVGFKFL